MLRSPPSFHNPLASGPNYSTPDRRKSAERGYDSLWHRLRAIYVRSHPLCELCKAVGIVTPVEIVHHKKPISTNPELRLNVDNLQSLCRQHHAAVHAH